MSSIMYIVQLVWSYKRSLIVGGVLAAVLGTYFLTGYVTHKTAYAEGYIAGVLDSIPEKRPDNPATKERIRRSAQSNTDPELDARMSKWLRD